MARLARVVAVGVPQHLTQRGNNRQSTFFDDDDRLAYCRLLDEQCSREGVRLSGYCLMSNHVHLAAIPERPESFARGLGRAHSLYTRALHQRRRRSGQLWQNRFFSCPLDRDHLWIAPRYVDLNPVRAQLVDEATEYEWSSARAHVESRDRLGLPATDLWRQVCPPDDWEKVLGRTRDEEAAETAELRRATVTGRPPAGEAFVERLEKELRRKLNPRRTGRPKKAAAAV